MQTRENKGVIDAKRRLIAFPNFILSETDEAKKKPKNIKNHLKVVFVT